MMIAHVAEIGWESAMTNGVMTRGMESILLTRGTAAGHRQGYSAFRPSSLTQVGTGMFPETGIRLIRQRITVLSAAAKAGWR
jgi:hypothetical protein